MDRRALLVFGGSALLTAVVLLSGCAIGVPAAIKDAPVSSISVSEAQQSENQFVGAQVRWGGTILSVRNHESATEIEILSRSTDVSGKPDADGEGRGRFIAEVRGFLDPAEFPKDRLLTVVGVLDRVEMRPVGDYPYRFPIVNARHRYLWPEPVPVTYPYGYPGPWFYPWYRPRWGPGYYW